MTPTELRHATALSIDMRARGYHYLSDSEKLGRILLALETMLDRASPPAEVVASVKPMELRTQTFSKGKGP